jgi:hypothetical protein
MNDNRNLRFRQNQQFLEAVAIALSKAGRTVLGDDDLLLLACEEISRTTTYEELNYTSGTSCTESS